MPRSFCHRIAISYIPGHLGHYFLSSLEKNREREGKKKRAGRECAVCVGVYKLTFLCPRCPATPKSPKHSPKKRGTDPRNGAPIMPPIMPRNAPPTFTGGNPACILVGIPARGTLGAAEMETTDRLRRSRGVHRGRTRQNSRTAPPNKGWYTCTGSPSGSNAGSCTGSQGGTPCLLAYRVG